MRPGGARAKGIAFELAIAKDLRAIWPEAKRGLQARGGGEEVPDVDVPIFHVECKHGILPNPRAALLQAIRDSEQNGKIPVAIVKDNRKKPIVVMRYADWLEVMTEWLRDDD